MSEPNLLILPEVRDARRDLCFALALKDLHLTKAEACAVCDVCNGTIFLDDASWQAVWAEVEDGIRLNALDVKWKIDGPTLVGRIHNSVHCHKLALVEAVERFWNNHQLPTDEALAAAGFKFDE